MVKKDYRIEDLIDIPLFQALQDKLNVIYSFPSAIIDNDGNVLTATAWQDLCVEFHRAHPECLKACKASDKYIQEHLGEAKPAVTYNCPHGLVDNATPIVIGGRHLANYFTGQFFLAPPDMEFFRAQAKKYCFDEKEYLAAVAKVPVWSKEKLAQYLDFVKGFTEIIAGIGYKNLQEKEAREALQEKESALADERRRVERLMEVSPAGIVYVDAAGAITYANRRGEELLGLSRSELSGLAYNAPAWKTKHPDGKPFLDEEQPFSVVKRTNKSVGNVEQEITWPDGRRVTLSINGAPLLSDAGEFLGMVAALEDITQREIDRVNLKHALKVARLGTWAWNIKADKLTWSEGMYEIFGIDRGSFTGNLADVISKAIHPEDKAAVDASNAKVALEGSPQPLEYRVLRPDGSVCWVYAEAAKLIRDAAGEPALLTGYAQDVTERKRAEERLIKLADQVPGVVYEYRLYPDGRSCFPYSSAGMNDIYEVTPESVREDATAVFGRIHPDDLKPTADAIFESARTLKAFQCELRMVLPRQGLRWRLSYAKPERLPDGGTLWYGIITDITEFKLAQEKVRESEARFSQLFETMAEGFATHEIICDAGGRPVDYRFLDVNPAFERLTGLKKENLVGRTCLEVIPSTEKIWIENYGRVALGGEPMHFESGSGALGKWYEVSAFSPRRGQFAVSFVDITERRKAQLQLEKVNKDLIEKKQDLENFLYITTHDLRGPLINIQGFSRSLGRSLVEVQELLASLPGETKARGLKLTQESIPEALGFISEGVTRMDLMIKALLKVSRLGRVEMSAEPVEMNAAMKSVQAALSYQLGQAGGEMRIEPLPPCRADKDFISQLFINLLDNAIKYRSPARKLEITVRGESRGGGAVVYTVADNGLGLKADELGRLGQVFFRGSSARHAEKGEGIGLAMVKRLAEMNGGRLWAESEEGEGSRFFIELPKG